MRPRRVRLQSVPTKAMPVGWTAKSASTFTQGQWHKPHAVCNPITWNWIWFSHQSCSNGGNQRPSLRPELCWSRCSDSHLRSSWQEGPKRIAICCELQIGGNNDGYWSYNHMSIQFEDCLDCIKVLYPQFDFVFLFDHSQAHAKKLTNTLDATLWIEALVKHNR